MRCSRPSGPGGPARPGRRGPPTPRSTTFVAAIGLAALAALALVGPARAALVVGVDDPREPLWLIDTKTNSYTPLLTGFGGQAIANDPDTQTLFFLTNTVTLYRWNYADGSQPVLVGNTTSATSSPFLSITGLGFDPTSDTLYGTRTLGNANDPEGLYTLNPATARATLVGPFPGGTSSGNNTGFDVGGFDIDPATGVAYGFNDRGDTGIYQIDLATGGAVKIADAPSTADTREGDPVDIDGVAVGDGKIYLTEDRAVQTGGRIHVYDIASGQYETPLGTPWFFNETFAGATWIPDSSASLLAPEPASLSLAALAALSLGLRRRR